MYQKNKKKNTNSVVCTVPRIPTQLYIPQIRIPTDLNVALRNRLIDNDNLTPLCRNYIKCIKSLSDVQRISRQNYFTIFKICLYLEQHELTREIEQHRLINHSIKKVISGECFIINVPSMDSENPVIMPDDTVTLYEAVSKQRITAKITKVIGNDITVRVLNPLTVGIFTRNKKFNIDFYSQNWPLRCCHRALKLALQHDYFKMIHPQLKTNSIDLISKHNIKYVNTNISKNKEQEQAIMKVLSKKAHPAPYIIFGPPGTGKTATLVEIICQIVKYYPMKNILVCTASNAAADEITLRLIDHVPTNMIHRLYASSRQRNSINKKIRKCSNTIGDIAIFLPKEILMLRKIVITTLVTSARLAAVRFREDHFSFIIIDEASQAIEPEMLIPLTLSCSETERTTFQAQVVIAGDPYQLGPVVRSNITRHLLGKSMLERLMDDCDPYKKENGKYNPNYVTKLIKNYRSHKHILHVSNKQFYNNELKSCGGFDTQIALNWQKLPAKEFPMIFQEVLGTEERTPSRSVYNTAEVLVVMEYVRMLMDTKFDGYYGYKVKEEDIGIITPFKQQQIQIIHQLEANCWGKISVGTIESFQGQERTIIILSTVRSKTFTHNGKKHIGFLSNPKRFNVAITRAKALMIIIGNPHIICQNEHWKILWEYCKKHRGRIPFEQCPLPPNLIAKLGSDYKKRLIDGNDTRNVAVGNRLSVTVEYGTKKITQKTLLDVLVRGRERLTDD